MDEEDVKSLIDEIENYRPMFEEFADSMGSTINEILGYSDYVNLCINATWILGFLAGKDYGMELMLKEFRKKYKEFEKEQNEDLNNNQD